MKTLKIFQLYLRFIILEIPNFIQIFSLLFFFTLFLSNTIYRLCVIYIISVLLFFYLIEKEFEFLKNQIIDIHSERNLDSLNDKIILRWWIFFSLITMCGFTFLIIYFSSLIKP